MRRRRPHTVVTTATRRRFDRRETAVRRLSRTEVARRSSRSRVANLTTELKSFSDAKHEGLNFEVSFF